MDDFLQRLQTLSLEEGKQHLLQHCVNEEQIAAAGAWLEREALEKLYVPFTSLKLAELLIFLGAQTHNSILHALGLKARGDGLVQAGHYKAAMKSLDDAGAIFLQRQDERNWARSRISWAVARAWLGDVEEALHAAERARAVFSRLNESSWVCNLDNNIAVIYGQAGRYQEALELYERMRAIYATLTDQDDPLVSRNIALVDLNQGVNLAWLGDFEQSYFLQCRARDRLRELGAATLELITEINIADLDYMQGYYGSALRRYYEVLDAERSSADEDPLRFAELKLVIAACLIKLNRAQEARQLASEAVTIYQQLDTSLNTIQALITHATALGACKQLDPALSALTEARRLAVQGHFEHQTIAIQLQEAELLLEKGEVSVAYEQASLVRQACASRSLIAYKVRAELVMANARLLTADERQNTRREAATLCEQVVRTARKYNLQEATYKSYHLLGRIAMAHGHLRKADRYYQAAIGQIERILDDLMYDLSPAFLHTAWAVYADMIALCLQQKQGERAFSYLERARSMALRQYLGRTRQADSTSPPLSEARLTFMNIQRELKEWQERYRMYSVLLSQFDASVSSVINRETIQAEFERSENKVSELFERLSLYQEEGFPRGREAKSIKRHTRRVFEVRQLQERLAEKQTLLAYFLHQGKLVIFALNARQVIWREIPEAIDQLEDLLPFLAMRLQIGGWPDLATSQQGLRTQLQDLYNLLINPILDMLPEESGLLTIVPYGMLHGLPFHILFDGSQFLIEKFSIHYLPASSILTTPRVREQTTNGEKKGRPVLFSYSDKGDLPYASVEVETLAHLLQGKCYLGEEATIARLVEEAPGSPIIHIATHSKSRSTAPNFSAVLLADGRLNAIDVFDLNLRDCELVTLSGCVTSFSMSAGGDEQLGLGRAFLAAGAETVVISLWSIEDRATGELMELFYRALLNGESKVEALRTAQRLFLARADLHHRHPYYWAAFRLVGSTQPLTWHPAIEELPH